MEGSHKKGDVLGIARVAGIMGQKDAGAYSFMSSDYDYSSRC